MHIIPRLKATITMLGILLVCVTTKAVSGQQIRTHGLVGLRPLPRYESDLKSNHGGSWAGMPTFEEQKGKYPFVAENVDIVKGWLGGDFKTERMFFEYYWGLSKARDNLDPDKNGLIKTICKWESKGAQVEHILITMMIRRNTSMASITFASTARHTHGWEASSSTRATTKISTETFPGFRTPRRTRTRFGRLSRWI